jgi:hypothetical protein
MNTAFYSTGKDITPRVSSPAVLIVLLAFVVGCAGSGNYGRLQRSRDVDQIFRTYRVLPDHLYYFTGPAGRPDAIMGIRNEYTLETTQWTQFSPSGDTLRKAVDSINFYHHTGVHYFPYGFFIVDPEGSRLGIWYSIWDWTTVIVKDDNRIEVFPPAKKDPFGNGDKPERMKND